MKFFLLKDWMNLRGGMVSLDDFDKIKLIILNKKLSDDLMQEYKHMDIEIKEDIITNNGSCIYLSVKEKAVRLHNYLGYLLKIETWISLNEFYWQQYCDSIKENKEFNLSQNDFLKILKDMVGNYLFLNKKIQEFILIHEIPLAHYDFLKSKYFKNYKKYSDIKNELDINECKKNIKETKNE